MLALSFLEWMQMNQPDWTHDIVAFRGGPLLDRFIEIGPVTVLLDPDEPWDHRNPDPTRVEVIIGRAAHLGEANLMLAVSVAAGQVLQYLPLPLPPLVTWSVEQGQDLHWVDGPIHLRESTDMWLAGSAGTARELSALLGMSTSPAVIPEFIADAQERPESTINNVRRSLSPTSSGLQVLGVGIATFRKGVDIFIEAALTASRTSNHDDQFTWIGGEHDVDLHRFIDESRRLGLENVRFLGNVVDIDPWLAAADVLLHTARLDAFPLVCLHAARLGTPVIGFRDTSALEEMFGTDAICATYPDTRELITLLDGLRDPMLRADAGERQHRRINGKHTASGAAEKLFEQLDSMVRSRHEEARSTGGRNGS